jgi:hypothetical protein
MRRFLGVSGAGSAKGSLAMLLVPVRSSVIPANGVNEETLLVFLRNTFLSLFLLDIRRMKSPPAAPWPCGSLIDRPLPLDVVEYTEPTLDRGTCR